MTRRLLALDVGGTKTALGLYALEGDAAPRLLRADSLPSEGEGVEPLVARFLADDRADEAVLGLAGPVRGETCALTNLPWVVSREALVARFGFAKLTLMNDVALASLGLGRVAPARMHALRAGEPEPGALRTLVMLGTGFGCASVYEGRALESEAGQAAFAATDARAWALRGACFGTRGPGTREQILSGAGLVRIYSFIRTNEYDEAASPSSAAEVCARAHAGEREAREACLWLVRLLGEALADIALCLLPRGGLYLAGGLVAGLGTLLEEGALEEGLLEGRGMRSLLASIPLIRVDEPALGLLGACEIATRGD